VVEDDADMRGLIADLLSHEGYRVEEAVTGIDALEKTRSSEHPPDVILLDLNLPMMDGWEFRVEQKRDPALARIPVVILSADAKAGAVDADHVLKKPFDANTLLETVARALRTSRRSRQAQNGNGTEPHVEGLRLIRKLGGGGMGVVYEAERDEAPNRVAVKILNIELASRPELVQRFKNEARAVALLRHPNIVAAIDVGATDQGLPFLVLELLEGRTLDEEIRAGGPMRIGRAVRLARQIASGLSAAHVQGIIHRDIKPGNVFLSRGKDGDVAGEQAKVLDFGVSKFQSSWSERQTKTGELLGTPNYMAPELFSDARAANARTDVYGLGATLYEMLTGRPPFVGGNFPVLMLQIMSDAPPSLVAQRPDVPTELFAVVERALDKANDRRWTDLTELGEALKPFENIDEPPHYVPIEDTPNPPVASTRRLRGPRRPRIARSSTALMVAAVGGLCLLGVGFQLRGRRSSIEISGAEKAAVGQVTLQVNSPAPEAKLRFRGAEHALPFSQTLSSTQEREPIEVTAPGHRGQRFWLLLDRDHTLRVELERGQGIADASESERSRAVVVPQP
jgi:serine/threonine protein kinase/CheY-like chemotaxis protein